MLPTDATQALYAKFEKNAYIRENIASILRIFEYRDIRYSERISILLSFLTGYHYLDITLNFKVSILRPNRPNNIDS